MQVRERGSSAQLALARWAEEESMAGLSRGPLGVGNTWSAMRSTEDE